MSRFFVIALLLTYCLTWYGFAASNQPPRKKAARTDRTAKNPRVEKLFAAMRQSKYDGVDFPQLEWADIPALLDLAASPVVLHTFPRNPLSSQYEPECSEGMVALWLVEGIRQGKRYPSLCALCVPDAPGPTPWTTVSEGKHAEVEKRYEDWWKTVKSLAPDKAAAVDPLKGAGLGWH